MQNDDKLIQLLFVLVPIFLFTLPFIHWVFAKREARAHTWLVLGEQLGLDYTDLGLGSPRLRGELDGRPVSARVESRSSGGYITTVRVELGPDVPPSLQLSPKGLFAKVDVRTGVPVLTGDASFDELFVVRADDEAEARRYLAPEHRRQALRALYERTKSCWITGRALTSQQQGILTGEEVERQLRVLIEAANQHVGHISDAEK